VLKYQVASPVRAVTPDGKLAMTSGTVIDVAAGKKLGDLATIGDVQALDSAGNTLYVATPGALTKVDLATFR
jgi:hypothetical protein